MYMFSTSFVFLDQEPFCCKAPGLSISLIRTDVNKEACGALP